MADPTYDSLSVSNAGSQVDIGSRRPRAYHETLPGVSGAYSMTFGYGPRPIAVTGYLTADAPTAAAALTAAMNAYRTLEARCDGQARTFVGPDGYSYDYCTLDSYVHGRPRIARNALAVNSYTALLPVVARLTQLVPSVTAPV